MITSRALPFLLTSILFMSVIAGQAQVTTNKAVLQQASQLRATREAEIKRIVFATAKEKGWPLTIKNKAGRLAYLRAVSRNGNPVYITTTDNIISAATIRTNTLWNGGSTGLNLSGSASYLSGKIAVWDEGLVRPTHVELVGRVTQKDGSTTLSDHSTHVAGTMIATGVNPVAKGMSYGAKMLNAYDFDNDQSEMMAAAANGLLVSNHSYAIITGWYYNSSLSRWEWYGNAGDSVDVNFGLYDEDTQGWDSIAYNAPSYLIAKASGNNRSENGPAVGDPYYRMNASHVWTKFTRAAGDLSNNDGYQIIATYGNAKNILTVGAVNPIPGGYTQPADVVLTGFSSWGPTGDGRIKPDVVADGYNVLSSISTSDNAYDIFSGTSMATPAVAGSSFLLQELWSRIHGNTSFLRSATLKGLLIHTADEAGSYPGPDYQYGWGLVNMQKAASVITSDTAAVRDQQVVESSIDNSTHAADSFTVVASGKQPLMATLVWTDPAGTPVTNITKNFQDVGIKLVNDLDLRITDMTTGGQTYLPWILDPSNRPAAATKGDNIRDNVEKVQVDSLIPGRTYKVKVTHKGTLSRGSQAYSLLMSGIGGTAYCTSASTGASGSYISKLSFGGISYTAPNTSCKTYTDSSTGVAASLPIGQSTPFSLSYISCGAATSNTNISIFIDFNNDGDFLDAGEAVLSTTAVVATPASGGTAATFSGSITAPASAVVGRATRMRVVITDGAPAVACGGYTAGETQDYRVVFTTPSNDIGVAALESPTQTSCASDSQIVTIRIRNYGTIAQTNIPVTTIIKNGGTTVATLTATCKDSIPAKSDVLFTYNTTFPATAGTTYTFTSSTALGTDPNTANDGNVTSVTISTNSATPTGTATICGTGSTTASLKATVSGSDLPLWYDSPTATTPIAAGANTTTTTIPNDKTYYLGLNDLKTRLGPPNKLSGYTNGAGAYFRFGGNFVQVTTSVPLTIESAKMYIAHNGQMTFTLATLATRSGNQYSYYPLYTTTIDVYPTKQVPVDAQQTNVAAGDNTDTGAIFNLNIPIPTPGSYIIIVDCSDHTSAFINFATGSTVPYPLSIPGVMSITGNDFYDAGQADSLTYYKKFYFPFYNMGIRLTGCPSPNRTAIVATTAATPSISLNGNVFTSTATTGNQWYRNDVALSGATGQTDTAIYSGVYKTVVTDPVTGCSLTSNAITFTSTGTTDPNGTTIGLKVSPNPNNGVFQLEFNMTTQDDLSISLLNTLGQTVYNAEYPNFVGQFAQQVNAGALASGMYVLRIVHGTTTYTRKVLVKR